MSRRHTTRGLTRADIDERIYEGKYPLRRCLSLHHCGVCGRQITLGQRYYDGGFDRRVHEGCATMPPPFEADQEGNAP